jgi:transcriptional regulator with XRE-family HTH domain
MVRIRVLRDIYGLTAEQLADRMAELGVSVNHNTLYNIERGAKKPSDRTLDAYARALGINPLDVWQGPLRPPVTSDHAALPPMPPASRSPDQDES